MRKLLVLFMGILLAALLFEGSLYSYNFFYAKKGMNIVKRNEAFTIVALGNSYTQGAGAPGDQSYPEHLKRIIQRERPDLKLEVYNWGLPGANSAMVLAKVRKDLNKMKPDLVILRGGQPNYNNLFRYNEYIKRDNVGMNYFQWSMLSIHNFLFKLRTYRFLVYLLWQAEENQSGVEREKRIKVKYWYEQHSKLVNKFQSVKYKLMSRKEAAENLEWLKGQQEKRPHCHNYLYMGKIHAYALKDEAKAIEYFIKGIKEDPWYYENLNYTQLKIYRNEYINAKEFIESWSKKHPGLSYRFDLVGKKSINKWIKSDLKEMHRIAREMGSKVVFHNYPVSNAFPERRRLVNSVVKSVAEDLGALFLDLEKVFEELKIQEADLDAFKRKYFVPDDHLNSLGYQINAEHLYKLIKENNLLGR